jgi:hypothetical protein
MWVNKIYIPLVLLPVADGSYGEDLLIFAQIHRVYS